MRSKPASTPILVDGQTGTSTSTSLSTGLASPDFNLPFFHYLVLPKNTTEATPYEYTLKLPYGVIFRVWLEFPRGCAGLAGVQIWRGANQIFPLPAGVWLRSDNAVLNFAFTHEVITNPFEVTLKGYNTDDTYQHTVWVGFEMRGVNTELSTNMRAFLRSLQA